jgi:hypothetical protein
VGEVAKIDQGEIIDSVIARGDLSQLNGDERARYYGQVCRSVGLNPLTKPFEYITLNGRLTLYARKDATDQLRSLHKVSVEDMQESDRDGVYIVTVKVKNSEGRTDMAKGAVSITNLKGEALANAMMKAETKAKRRATLSICGLGFLDETEIEDIPAEAKRPQTLPKKDARDIYTRLQKEVDQHASRNDLLRWGQENADRIKVLPEDWQDILRLRYQERMVDLQAQEAKAAKAADPLEIPAALKRNGKMPNHADDLQGWLKWLDNKLAFMATQAALETYWNDTIAPMVDQMFPPDQAQAMQIFERHEARIAA